MKDKTSIGSQKTSKAKSLDNASTDALYGLVDTIIFRVFKLGFDVDHEHYSSANDAEPHYEDNLDSYTQDIMTKVEELLETLPSVGGSDE